MVRGYTSINGNANQYLNGNHFNMIAVLKGYQIAAKIFIRSLRCMRSLPPAQADDENHAKLKLPEGLLPEVNYC